MQISRMLKDSTTHHIAIGFGIDGGISSGNGKSRCRNVACHSDSNLLNSNSMGEAHHISTRSDTIRSHCHSILSRILREKRFDIGSNTRFSQDHIGRRLTTHRGSNRLTRILILSSIVTEDQEMIRSGRSFQVIASLRSPLRSSIDYLIDLAIIGFTIGSNMVTMRCGCSTNGLRCHNDILSRRSIKGCKLTIGPELDTQGIYKLLCSNGIATCCRRSSIVVSM